MDSNFFKKINTIKCTRLLMFSLILVVVLLPAFSMDFHIVVYANPIEYLSGFKSVLFVGVLTLLGSPLFISFYFFTKRVGIIGSALTLIVTWIPSLILTNMWMEIAHATKLKLLQQSILNTGWSSQATMDNSFDVCMLQIWWHSLAQAVIVFILFFILKLMKKSFTTNKNDLSAAAAILVVLCFTSSGKVFANNLADAKMYEKQGKFDKAAIAATNGCISQDIKSCAFLCALGIKIQSDDYEKAGCAMACTLGDGMACASYGSTLIKRGDTAEGLRTLNRGCQLHNKIACSQLKLLNQK